MENKFEIDFFELSFLVEASIPPKPIARTHFWYRLIDEIYYELSESQREDLFNWITKNEYFDLGDEDCNLFYNRFNPDNQYKIITNYDDNVEEHHTFRGSDGRYYTSRNSSIVEDYIVEIIKL